MKIGLDARTVYRTEKRGTARNLIDLYRTVCTLKPNWQIHAYHAETKQDDSLNLPNVHPHSLHMPGHRLDLWRHLALPLRTWRDGVDLLHCPANLCPAKALSRTLVTIHDLIPLDHSLDTRRGKQFQASVKRACRSAAGIICPSQYTADRLVHEYGAASERITVNPWAPDQTMRHIPESQAWPVAEEYGLDRPYVLHFGAYEPRKNTRRVIEAWWELPRDLKQQYQLLIVGLDERILEPMKRLCTKLELSHSVQLHGFAPAGDLPSLLSAAAVLAYPSLSEGFGLPVLDAWTTRTAVLTSNTTSLPEVTGDAGELVDPTDAEAIAGGLFRLLADAELRHRYVEAGTRRLAPYTWQATAERFIHAAERAAGQALTDFTQSQNQSGGLADNSRLKRAA